MSHPSDPSSLVLHLVKLKGVASPATVAAACGLGGAEVSALLDDLAACGLVQHPRGRSEWALTAVGHKEHATRMAEELEASACRPTIEDAYRRFLELNPELLAVCTAWQLHDGGAGLVANDHTDAGYDRAVVERLSRVHHQVGPIVDDLGACLERFCRYGPRLGAALDRVLAGDTEWFTRPLIDSYHSVWFELHQDLLDTLGIERGTERTA